jgi:hypothetical protein
MRVSVSRHWAVVTALAIALLISELTENLAPPK